MPLRLRLSTLLFLIAVGLTGCLPATYGTIAPEVATAPAKVEPPVQNTPIKAAILLPLSGRYASLGAAMQNAAQLALQDLRYPMFELLPKDTQSTPAGAQKAARDAINEGAQVFLGPIFAEEIRGVKSLAQGADIPMIAFSTDITVAGPNAFIMGILPHDQAKRIAEFAAEQKRQRVLIVANKDLYGQTVVKTFAEVAEQLNLPIAGVVWLDKNKTLNQQLAPYFGAQGFRPIQSTDTVFLPLSTEQAVGVIQVMRQMPGYDQRTMRLGTGLWDDVNLAIKPELIGSYYAAPAPDARHRFEQNYQRNFGNKPPRLASLSYDATALAVVVGRQAGPEGYHTTTLANTNGFTGIDGLFRFKENGTVERSLAIIQLQPGRRVVVVPSLANFPGTE